MMDEVTLAGGAFDSMGICPGVANMYGVVQLWNPPGSDICAYLDEVDIGVLSGSPGGGDLRVNTFPLSNLIAGSILNKNPLIAPPGLQMRHQAMTAAQIQPDGILPSPPGREFWIKIDNGKTSKYPWVKAPRLVPPGHGACIAMSPPGATLITSWQGRVKPWEIVLPTGTISDGDPIGDLDNVANAFDGSAATYASGPDAVDFRIGKNGYAAARMLQRFVLKSPPGRSLNGRGNAGVYTWTLHGTNNGSTFTQIDTGTRPYSGSVGQEVFDVTTTNTATAYTGHRVTVSDSDGLTGWRVGSVELYEIV
jgi:hypothetical protein